MSISNLVKRVKTGVKSKFAAIATATILGLGLTGSQGCINSGNVYFTKSLITNPGKENSLKESYGLGVETRVGLPDEQVKIDCWVYGVDVGLKFRYFGSDTNTRSGQVGFGEDEISIPFVQVKDVNIGAKETTRKYRADLQAHVDWVFSYFARNTELFLKTGIGASVVFYPTTGEVDVEGIEIKLPPNLEFGADFLLRGGLGFTFKPTDNFGISVSPEIQYGAIRDEFYFTLNTGVHFE